MRLYLFTKAGNVNTSGRVILVTGASSGIGQACAEHLAGQGYRVFGTSRHPERVPALAGPVQMIQLDVDDDDSVHAAVSLIVREAGRLDGLVNSAGISIVASVEDTSLALAKQLFETNFFGALRVTQAVLPIMRRQHSGTIVHISSMAGQVGAPYQGLYSAAKFALEGMSETLRMEVMSFGVHIALVEPGDVHTPLTQHRQKFCSDTYAGRFQKTIEVIEADETSGPSPDGVAQLVGRILRTPSPALRYAVGTGEELAGLKLKKFVPARLFEWALMKRYKLL